ncbi:MAG: hypothetical protein K2I87_01155, partial [Bacteroidales bacterium]|nr:hypothetical protein [Bacteroidales bacterium]
MQSTLRRLAISLAILAFFPAAKTAAQHDDILKNSFKEKIEAIKFSPLEALPVSDCRLAELESEIFLAYTRQNRDIPADLRFLAEQKRRQIDQMRSHIDSLYYIQALQAVNQKNPDWELAKKNIEKALLHNRFFTKAIVFKITCLSLEKQDTQALLQYLHAVLQECGHPQKIRQTAQAVYGRILKETEELISRKLYSDALDLCRLLETYFLPEFPVRYMRYKEELLRNMAHQGIYRSYCEVAEKAFSQRQYQLAQRYALQAFDYFKAFEEHMDGVNRVLALLDRIATEYSRIAGISDREEKAFYSALIDTIVNRTGLVLIPRIEYRLEEDLAQELALLNQSLTAADTVVEKQEKPTVAEPKTPPQPVFAQADTRTVAQSNTPNSAPAVRLSPQQARKQFETACEQARFLHTKRKFPEAYAWYKEALELKRQYKLKADADFDDEYLNTLSQAVEQLVNKAVFQLWSHNETRADSLYTQASALFESYREKYPDALAEMAIPQQFLDSYLQKRNENRCRKWLEKAEQLQADFYRQASFGNYASAQEQLQELDTLLAMRQQAEFAACEDHPAPMEDLRAFFAGWTSYRQHIEDAFAHQR